MKKNYFLIAILSFTMISMNAQFAMDDMESYGGGNTPIYEGAWSDWGCGGTCSMFSSGDQSQSGALSGKVDDSGTMDPLLLLGNKIFGQWGLKMSIYVPSGNIGYFNVQGDEAPGIQWVIGNIYLGNSGVGGDGPNDGRIDLSTADEADDFTFTFPSDMWFDVVMNFDLSSGMSLATYEMMVDGVEVVPAGTAFADGTGEQGLALGAINLFSISNEMTMYVDDILYTEGFISENPIDTVDPIAICQNHTVQLNNNGIATINGISIDGGSTDNVGIVSYTAVPDTFTCNDLGTNVVTLIVSDAAGNTDTCISIVTVEDNLNPNVNGQNATADLNGSSSVTIPVSSVNIGSTDNCNIVNLTLSPNTFTATGTYVSILEGTDSSGNTGNDTVIITIIDSVDSEDPVANCQDIAVQLNSNGTASINGINIDGGSTDNVGIVSYTAVPDSFNCNDLGTNVVTLIVEDAAGNTDTCISIVTVEDNVDPNVIGQNATGNLNGTGSVTIPVSSVDNGSTDNCSIVNLTLSPNTFTATGTYTAILNGIDPSGNSDNVTVIITVIDTVDNQDPVANCQDITIQLNSNGSATIVGNNIDGGSTDNIGIVSYTAVPSTFNCNDLGSNAVTLIVEDAAGNTDTCISIVTIEDNLNPTVIGQNATGNLNGSTSVMIPVSSVDNGSADNCSITSMTLTPDIFTTVGTYTAELEGTDQSGNSDSVTVIITIIDTILNITDQETTSFTMYPNPANTKVTIDVGDHISLRKIEIYDIIGKLIIDKTLEQSTQTYSVDISDLPSSVYFVSVIDEYEKRTVKKLIKE